MRTVIFGVAVFFSVSPASAQTVLAKEPHTLNPFAVVYVQGGNCSAGKVMKVTGMDRRQRRRACVALDTASVAH